MKRKKWSEAEEKSLLTKYSDLVSSGALSKLKTREKKFKPIADHVSSQHHLRDPLSFPFRWSWRDVSIKVQNMRHQYLGVKQKIRLGDNLFNWSDADNHWDNFSFYKQVFGDVELDVKEKSNCNGADVLGLGFEIDSEELVEEDGDMGEDEIHEVEGEKKMSKKAKKLGLLGGEVVKLREEAVRREERRRERDWSREEEDWERDLKRREREKEIEEHEREMMAWHERELERRSRLERDLEEKRRRRMKIEERWEEEEMEWRERMVNMQIEHEKQMLNMHANACHNQMQIIGAMARLVCQFFGSVPNDGLGTLSSQVLQNLQHPNDGLGDNGKPDSNSPSEFL